MKTNDEILQKFNMLHIACIALQSGMMMGNNTEEDCLKSYERLEDYVRTILTQKDAEVAERINKEMALHTPALTAKKPKAYNEGLLSGWYAARAFIKTLTPHPTEDTSDKTK